MKSCRLLLGLSVVAVLAAPALTQQHTLARLSRESRPDVGSADISASKHRASSAAALRDSSTSRAAADALFTRSDLERARVLSDRALRRDPQDAEALFVRMELSGLEGDHSAALQAAVRLCEAGAYASADPRVRLAEARVREAAANTPTFRAVLPQLRTLADDSPQTWRDLQLALLNAAMDGVPGLNPYALTRAAGILGDWRIAGPVGSRPLLDADRATPSPADYLTQDFYSGRAVENFQFPDGWIRLPDYLPRHGIFYAATKFASFTSETRQLSVEGGGGLEIYIDGERVLFRTGTAPGRDTANFEATPGPHRVLVKFAASATPLRVAVFRAEPDRTPLRPGLSSGEAAYLLAAEHYADGEFAAAAKQIEAMTPEGQSAALQALRMQALENAAAAGRGSDIAAQSAEPDHVAPGADHEAGVWASRIAQHPSCTELQKAIAFYGSHDLPAEKDAAQQKLDGCAPESLAYAQSLAQDGKHEQAAQALRQLLAGAPLNREARFMLIRELQLSGEDAAAQRAAADWLRIAPNAASYHRLAASAEDAGEESRPDTGAAFYAPYRNDAVLIARQVADEGQAAAAVVLLEDHVAIARADGSVSLYVHSARRVSPADAFGGLTAGAIPRDAQVLTWRVLHADGSATDLAQGAADVSHAAVTAVPGDVIDAEYVVNFTGDGGIPEHAEAFQFVFGSFDEPVLNARFVVLTPADHGDGGVVIATGEPPEMTAAVHNGMLQRAWEKTAQSGSSHNVGVGSAVVRVVESDNGWSVPSNAERQRRIETIHPGPRPEDS